MMLLSPYFSCGGLAKRYCVFVFVAPRIDSVNRHPFDANGATRGEAIVFAKREKSLKAAPATPARVSPASATPLVSWSVGLSVGVESIDDQHKALVEMINLVHSALHAEITDDELIATFRRMAEFTAFHFRHEEELMRRTQYPYADTHAGCHADLLNSFDGYQKDLSRECSSNAMRAHLQMLRDWLLRHIRVQDRDLGDWLNRECR